MISMKQIVEWIQVDRGTIYRWMEQEMFPRPVNVGDNIVRFWLDEVQGWQKQREQQSAAPLPKNKIKPVKKRRSPKKRRKRTRLDTSPNTGL